MEKELKDKMLEAFNDRHFEIEQEAVRLTKLAAEWNKLRDLSVDCVNSLLADIDNDSTKALDNYINTELNRLKNLK